MAHLIPSKSINGALVPSKAFVQLEHADPDMKKDAIHRQNDLFHDGFCNGNISFNLLSLQ
jgi:hypothetical protein